MYSSPSPECILYMPVRSLGLGCGGMGQGEAPGSVGPGFSRSDGIELRQGAVSNEWRTRYMYARIEKVTQAAADAKGGS